MLELIKFLTKIESGFDYKITIDIFDVSKQHFDTHLLQLNPKFAFNLQSETKKSIKT